MEYIVDNTRYLLSYENLKQQHIRFCRMSDKKFMENIVDATHLACVIAYLKELGAEATISDKGIIHELVHLQSIDGYDFANLSPIRKKFKTLLKLA